MDQMIAATIGNFDGVHRGHRHLLDELKDRAQQANLEPRTITFDVPPVSILRPGAPYTTLCTLEEKKRLIREYVGTEPIVLTFNRGLASITAQDFLIDTLYKRLGVRLLCVGYDHKFGKGRTESFDDYVRYGQRVGLEVVRSSEFTLADDAVSSTAIRTALGQTHLSEANEMLGYTYTLGGIVEGGFRNGRLMGYPTANIRPCDPHKLIPADGVYAVLVHLASGVYGGMLYIGHRPTMNNGTHRTIEVNIFDLSADLYGSDIRVEFIAYTRGDIRFDNVEDLVARLSEDARFIRRILSFERNRRKALQQKTCPR